MILVHVDHLKNIKHVMVDLLNKPLVRVAVGLVTDRHKRLLITQRSPEISHGGFWEFPGGKLELHEAPEVALFRELKEEVRIQVLAYRYLGEVHHEYDKYRVKLYGYHVTMHRGQAICGESQIDLRWVASDELQNYKFPQANSDLIIKYQRLNKIQS